MCYFVTCITGFIHHRSNTHYFLSDIVQHHLFSHSAWQSQNLSFLRAYSALICQMDQSVVIGLLLKGQSETNHLLMHLNFWMYSNTSIHCVMNSIDGFNNIDSNQSLCLLSTTQTKHDTKFVTKPSKFIQEIKLKLLTDDFRHFRIPSFYWETMILFIMSLNLSHSTATVYTTVKLHSTWKVISIKRDSGTICHSKHS